MLGHILIDIIGASFAGVLFWIIVTELGKGHIEAASVFFALLVFNLLINYSTKISNLKEEEDSE